MKKGIYMVFVGGGGGGGGNSQAAHRHDLCVTTL